MPAVLAGCGTLTGMALCFALGSSGGADLLLYSAADALLAAGIGFGLRKFAPERPGMGTLLVGAAVAAALGSVRWGWFSPGVLACAAAELALCCRAQRLAALSGSAVLGAFKDAGYGDRVYAFIAPKLVGGSQGFTPIGGVGCDYIEDSWMLDEVEYKLLGQDLMITGLVRKEDA